MRGHDQKPLAPVAQNGSVLPLAGSRLNVVMFSGGSGTRSITEALLRQEQIALTILVNAYDDGHSTGRLRRFIPGMLGPSDIRKNIGRMMRLQDRCEHSLRAFSDYRLPLDISSEAGLEFVSRLADGEYGHLAPALKAEYEFLSIAQAARIRELLAHFCRYSTDQRQLGRYFDYGDCAVGNIIFAGCFLECDRDFNSTIEAMAGMYNVRGRILNVTGGENLFLVARKEDGTILPGEAEIVSTQNPTRITELMLLDGALYLENEKAFSSDPACLAEVMRIARRTPAINPDAAAVIRSADVIIYGPGTQHSSLLPSYMTASMGEAIAENRQAEKVFISNIRRDCDIPQEDAADIAAKFLRAISREGDLKIDWSDVATRFFFQRANGGGSAAPEYVAFEPSRLSFPPDSLCVRDWEERNGAHTGGYVVCELQSLVQRRVSIRLRPVRHLVSIVVPVLDEAPRIQAALESLASLDFGPVGLNREIIVVDGCSTDGTYELAVAVPDVSVCRLERRAGRGAAMRKGIEHARGDTIVFFPADLEYNPEDLYRIVGAIVRNEHSVVFGTRNVKCSDLSARLSEIYGDATGLYLLSKYGGMMLSMATLFLYNRYVSDLLTCMMGFDAALLRSLNLRSDGLEIQTEIVSKLCRRHEYILEIPVDYMPRTRAQGKKTTPLQGLKAMLPLVRQKFASNGTGT